ncbi:hypothetical protein [Aliidiomarina soli]|uniref:Lipoprotein n=1 Tax=Aliidiomarina soli TaxID=1928574 RepID=A0A432WFE0_9GAMM|nr:hypothetical protein [Aliidiomarina soli]RUO32475.1 hypothetical protein CWE14_10030 [Aliidiomarina soli]
MLTKTKWALLAATTALTLSACGGFDYGDDSGLWTMDRECDDPRFVDVPGTPGGMASSLDENDTRRDATDCEGLHKAGWIEPR